MSRKEARRPGLVQLAVAGKITTAEGARSLEMSLRQFRRLKVRYRAEGVRGLVHRRRGQPSGRGLDVEVRDRVVELVQTTYRDFNDCHCTEKLRDVEGLRVSRSTVRRLRRARGLPPKRRRRPPQHRARRPRRPAMGSLVLVDGSEFDWLGTGTPLFLLGAIDDATSAIVALHFRPAEDLHGYLTLLRQLAARVGLPVTLYGDRLGVFVRNDDHWSLEEELQGAQHPTHFGAILRDLGIGYIAAHSPQAKGRIERLWETLQDRLVAELRLHGIQTVAAAEAFLPTYLADHNRRLAQPPAETTAAWRRPPVTWPSASAAAIRAAWPATTPCASARASSRSRAARTGARTPAAASRSGSASMAGCSSTIRDAAWSPPRRRRPISSSVPGRRQRLRASRSPSEEGGRHLPLGQNGRVFADRGPHRPGPAPAPPGPPASVAADLLAPATRTPSPGDPHHLMGGHFH